jgi:hypothetical protein
VARDGLLGESRPSAYLANAAVCNICITSELPVRTRTRVHGQKVLNHVLQAEFPALISGVAADTHRFTTCNPDTHNESHSDRANLATRSIVKLHKPNTWAIRWGPC